MKYIISLLLYAAMAMPADACDVCGCQASGQSLGLLPQVQYHFVGLQYQYSAYESNHPSLFDNNAIEHGKDYYHTVQAWGRFNAGKHLQLYAFVPYRYNVHYEEVARSMQSGIGDISFLVNGIIIRQKDSAVFKHQLTAGGGLKLPTGRYDGIAATDLQGLPNMQPGTGAVDFLLNVNYTVQPGRMGFNADAAYTFTLPNKDNYKYGNRLSAGLLGFYTVQSGAFTLLPQAGVRVEYSLHDYDRRWLNKQSGGYIVAVTAGLQAYYKQLGARLTYQLPFAQQYANGYVEGSSRAEAGLFFLL